MGAEGHAALESSSGGARCVKTEPGSLEQSPFILTLIALLSVLLPAPVRPTAGQSALVNTPRLKPPARLQPQLPCADASQIVQRLCRAVHDCSYAAATADTAPPARP